MNRDRRDTLWFLAFWCGYTALVIGGLVWVGYRIVGAFR